MKDYFSDQSDVYAKNRPGYPDDLFRMLHTLCTKHELAWDCATGNGQCAVALAEFFTTVYATDGSKKQIENSFKQKNIFYKVELAEHASLETASADLITVATAIHWFNIPEFYAEAHRVLKPEGLLAVWSYGGCSVNPDIDKLINFYAFDYLKKFWPVETQLNWVDRYKSLAFPYPQISLPAYTAKAEQNRDEFISYLDSWSAVQVFIKSQGYHPLSIIHDDLMKAWGDREKTRTVSWELFMKCGRK